MSERDNSNDMDVQARVQFGRPLVWVSPKRARSVVIALHVVAILSVLIEVLPFGAEHAPERIHAIEFVGSFALYGFISCIILVLLGRELRRLVKRDENYWDSEY